ncbi:MAG: efflux RND transporter periplasmic adaptor subunit [Planctomycetes bacterium]|nr:efflux RND transporter periplasmic adaptor subunit [Planctomycetota bacterium]
MSAPSVPRASSGARPMLPAVLALVLGLLLGRFACAPSAPAPSDAASSDDASPAAVVWTCAMHPQIRRDAPGACPICGMDLIPAASAPGDDALPAAALRMSSTALALADVQTTRVERRAVSREVRMVGKVDFDQTRLAYITAWVPARLDRLYVDSTGVPVSKGDHMVEVYSPQLIASQQELLSAIDTEKTLAAGDLGGDGRSSSEAVAAAKDRLRLMGLEPWQIDQVVELGEPLEHVTIHSPASGIVIARNALPGDYVETGARIYTIADLSRVWVQLDAYESDLQWLHYGQRVTFETEAFPGETFQGRVSLVAPVLDDRTRTVKVRLVVDNADQRLKPDMFVRATVSAPLTAAGRLMDAELVDRFMCPMHPEVVADVGGTCPVCGMDLVPTAELGFRAAAPDELPLVIPDTAPLLTGTRAVVYVQHPDDGGGGLVFEGREVVLGPRAGHAYVVRSGLSEGERVVSRGAFKLDSELQIRARPSMMNPASAPADVGSAAGTGTAPDADAEPASASASASETETETAPVPETASASASAPAAETDAADARVALDAVLLAALDVQRALASDDALGAAAASARLADRASALAAPLVAPDTCRTLLADAATLRDAEDLAARRAAFAVLSDALVPLVDSAGGPADESLVLIHCPMAFEHGADWIQRNGPVANPYFGARMLRCGTLVRGFGKER